MSALRSIQSLFRRDEAPSPAPDTELLDLLAPGHLVILSAACCDAVSAPRDEALGASVARAIEMTAGRQSVLVATLTDTQRRLKAQGATLSDAALRLREQLASVFQAHGLAAFPLLLVDGEVAFYGGVPQAEAIARRLGEGTRTTP